MKNSVKIDSHCFCYKLFLKASQVAEYESRKNLFPRVFSTYSLLTLYQPRSSALRCTSIEIGSTHTDSNSFISFAFKEFSVGIVPSVNAKGIR